VICKAFGAVALWILGYPDQARRQSREAIAMSRRLSPSSQAVAMHFSAMLHQLCRDAPLCAACAEDSHAIASEHGYSFWRAGATILGGWSLASSGAAEGVDRLRQGLREWEQIESVTYLTYFLGLLADVLFKQGLCDEAQGAVRQALQAVEQTNERMVEAELHRLQGDLSLPDARQAEPHYRKALAVAREQEAKSFELRAAMSLAQLHMRERQLEEAKRVLAPTLEWFTEGFDTADLIEARRMLGEISG
jgi:predicted ATPase